jgi:hypothetical protein
VPRYFTLRQAEQLLPQVESAIRDAIALKSEYQKTESEIQEFQRRVSMQGGVRVDRAGFLDRQRRRDSTALQLNAAIETIQDYGCLVKDLDIGLLDFPTLLNGQEVYLCWKLGENGIHFWHRVEEGFRGRKPVDQDFLEQHQGDLPN